MLCAALVLGAWAVLPGCQPGKNSIAPSGEQAGSALMNSPRHGEWVDVPAGEGDTPVRSWIVYPQREGPAPVVIVIHEIYGMTDWIRAVTDQLAAEGFLAIAPDLLSGKGSDGGGSETFSKDSARSAIRQLDPDEVVRRLNAVGNYARKLSSSTNQTGVMGFCWGGRTAFLYATRQPKLDAAVVFYGTAPDDEQALADIRAPVLGLYGGDDARVTSTVSDTRKAMEKLGKKYRTEIFEGAGHGFMRQQSGRDGANQQAAKIAWPMAVSYLEQHLKSK